MINKASGKQTEAFIDLLTFRALVGKIFIVFIKLKR